MWSRLDEVERYAHDTDLDLTALEDRVRAVEEGLENRATRPRGLTPGDVALVGRLEPSCADRAVGDDEHEAVAEECRLRDDLADRIEAQLIEGPKGDEDE